VLTVRRIGLLVRLPGARRNAFLTGQVNGQLAVEYVPSSRVRKLIAGEPLASVAGLLRCQAMESAQIDVNAKTAGKQESQEDENFVERQLDSSKRCHSSERCPIDTRPTAQSCLFHGGTVDLRTAKSPFTRRLTSGLNAASVSPTEANRFS